MIVIKYLVILSRISYPRGCLECMLSSDSIDSGALSLVEPVAFPVVGACVDGKGGR